MAGHIIPQPNGKYRLIVSDGQTHDGKRKRHSKTVDASSMKQAEKQLALFVAEVESGQEIDTATCTFKGFAERWLRDYCEPNMEYRTIQRYRDMLNHMTYAEIGRLQLSKVQPLHLIALYKKLGSNGACSLITPLPGWMHRNRGLLSLPPIIIRSRRSGCSKFSAKNRSSIGSRSISRLLPASSVEKFADYPSPD